MSEDENALTARLRSQFTWDSLAEVRRRSSLKHFVSSVGLDPAVGIDISMRPDESFEITYRRMPDGSLELVDAKRRF
jgi:hypothetical protein